MKVALHNHQQVQFCPLHNRTVGIPAACKPRASQSGSSCRLSISFTDQGRSSDVTANGLKSQFQFSNNWSRALSSLPSVAGALVFFVNQLAFPAYALMPAELTDVSTPNVEQRAPSNGVQKSTPPWSDAVIQSRAPCMIGNSTTSLVGKDDTKASGFIGAALNPLAKLGSKESTPQKPKQGDNKTAEVGSCLLGNCQAELARCLADPGCIENLACLRNCDGRPDESDCQIRCGDLYNDQAVMAFNSCAVTEKNCVPQRKDDGAYPVPPASALRQDPLNLRQLTGRWYISAGLNPLFDIFDCQVHTFNLTSDGIAANLKWRVKKPNGRFYTRTDVQTFVQDKENPNIMYNHDNEFLHYQDDWYVADFDKDKGIFAVYYRGKNDAWDGYGGAVVYSRTPTLPQAAVPQLTDAFKKFGINFSDFAMTDNSCPAEPPFKVVKPTDLDTLADDLRAIEGEAARDVVAVEREVIKDARGVEKALEDEFVTFGKFTVLKNQQPAPAAK